jgi:16S rRNA A1518/A1519 N6-dimethyltransferase RsmA/KsgA/DIM1 with predicted DNA glycosylase/AP lyase activity
MLPDNLLIETAISSGDKRAVKSDSGEQTKDVITINKKNEMSARDQQANVYHTFLNPIHVLCEQNTFKDFLKLSSKDVVVELGCGTGKLTHELTACGAFSEYIAVDFQKYDKISAQIDNKTQRRSLSVTYSLP